MYDMAISLVFRRCLISELGSIFWAQASLLGTITRKFDLQNLPVGSGYRIAWLDPSYIIWMDLTSNFWPICRTNSHMLLQFDGWLGRKYSALIICLNLQFDLVTITIWITNMQNDKLGYCHSNPKYHLPKDGYSHAIRDDIWDACNLKWHYLAIYCA